jgi:8-oxo-dGTP pyrophosphatase MutT (NUDIX family)
MKYATAVQELKRALSGPLAEARAMALMSPRTLTGDALRGRGPRPNARQAGALVLLFPDAAEEAVFVLTERSPHLPAHPGQIGLPGGMQAAGESLERTALREAEEEIGIDAKAVIFLGALSSVYIPPTDIVLHPFVGHLESPPVMRALPREVTRIFEVPLAALLDAESIHTERRELPIGEAIVPYFHLAEQIIWGATAIVLAELRTLLVDA